MENLKQESLKPGDRCKATVRHETNGEMNLVNEDAIFIKNNGDGTADLCVCDYVVEVPFCDIKLIP